MLPVAQLAGSFLGGGDKGSTPSSTASTSGDATSGLTLDFTSNNAFSVGGSGQQSQTATAAGADKSAGIGSNVLTYAIIAVGAVALIGVLAWSFKRKAS